jgi:hypothetical protein
MIRLLIAIVLLFTSLITAAQNDKLVARMKQFHQLMIQKVFFLENYVHDSLSYGHSNGWVENAKQFRKDLGTIITYHSIKEDSITAVVSGKTGYIRFVADIDVTLRGVRTQFRLRVLEVWVKRRNNWKIIARQAVRN